MKVTDFFRFAQRVWLRAAPANPSTLQALREASPPLLPAAYVEFLEHSNGGEGPLDIEPLYLQIWPAENVSEYSRGYSLPERLPSFYGFGSNGGGELLAFDTRTTAPWPIYAIPCITPDARDALFVAHDFLELLDHVRW